MVHEHDHECGCGHHHHDETVNLLQNVGSEVVVPMFSEQCLYPSGHFFRCAGRLEFGENVSVLKLQAVSARQKRLSATIPSSRKY